MVVEDVGGGSSSASTVRSEGDDSASTVGSEGDEGRLSCRSAGTAAAMTVAVG